MRQAAWNHSHAAGAQPLLATGDMEKDLALQHIKDLVHFSVRMEGVVFHLIPIRPNAAICRCARDGQLGGSAKPSPPLGGRMPKADTCGD